MRTGQQEFNWQRAAQLRALDQLQLPAEMVGDDGRAVSPALIMATLRALDAFAGRKGRCWPALATLTAHTRYKSKRSVQRALFALEALGLIRTTQGRTPQGYRCVCWEIQWSVIFGFDQNATRRPATAAGQVGRLASGDSDESPGWNSHQSPGDTGASPDDTGAWPDDTGSSPIEEPPMEPPIEPTPSAPSGGGEVEDARENQGNRGGLLLATVVDRFGQRRGRVLRGAGADWGRVAQRLSEAGVRDHSCLRAARRAGVTPEHVLQLIDWWQDRQAWWEPVHAAGVLHARIRQALPGIALEAGWRDGVSWRVERWHSERAPRPVAPADAAPAPTAAELPDLAPWLETLDRLSRQDLLDLAERCGPWVARRVRTKGATPAIRSLLARELRSGVDPSPD